MDYVAYRLWAMKNLEHILDALVWRWYHCKTMVIFKRHVASVNHHRSRKYFTSTHPAPTGTISIPSQIDLVTLKNNVIIWWPNSQTRLHTPAGSVVKRVTGGQALDWTGEWTVRETGVVSISFCFLNRGKRQKKTLQTSRVMRFEHIRCLSAAVRFYLILIRCQPTKQSP